MNRLFPHLFFRGTHCPMQSSNVAGIILAAGKGTRMKSDLPKGLHAVCGVPMVELIGRAMQGAGVERPIIVVGHGGERIQSALGDVFRYAWQREQLGTGHAALMALEQLDGHEGPVLVTPGDTPLLDETALQELVEAHREAGADCTVATVRLEDPTGYGRIVVDDSGCPTCIVEERDASEEIRAIREVCTSVYCFSADALRETLPTLGNTNAQGEYYLTDMVSALRARGGRVTANRFDDPGILVGVNDRWQLAEADRELRRRILRRHALEGVGLMDIDSIVIGPDVVIGPDTIIEPHTILLGATEIGAGCRIGPFSRLLDSHVGDGSLVLMSLVTRASIGRRARCGPFANLRPGAILGDDVKVGNFVEVKNATLADEVSVSHLSYIGDASVGSGTNVGAGTITCNYDGFEKHRTEIGENAFVGSNSTLVAPVTIGDGALVAAGSVVTRDVPGDALALGRARQENREEWAAQWRRRKSAES
jgi:bifunctional UDP-N-acetylglucosamine pyrophosphorylase / glucosamine-1-phosphate N-acetyltransferase